MPPRTDLSAGLVLSMPDFVADTLAHALAKYYHLAHVMSDGQGGMDLGPLERAVAEGLAAAARACGYQCPSAGGLGLPKDDAWPSLPDDDPGGHGDAVEPAAPCAGPACPSHSVVPADRLDVRGDEHGAGRSGAGRCGGGSGGGGRRAADATRYGFRWLRSWCAGWLGKASQSCPAASTGSLGPHTGPRSPSAA
jgi:hypothetical protein